jgi:hypothetical protein
MLRASLIRDIWISIDQCGLAAPLAEKANAFYSNSIGRRTGRYLPDTAKMDARRREAPESKRIPNSALRPSTGIMALHQAVPNGNRETATAKAPGLHNQIDINNKYVSRYLKQGAITASGVSGSINVLVHFAEYARQTYQVDLPDRDVFLGAAEFVVHDGGHSFHEALWVQDKFDDGRHSLAKSGVPPQSYAEIKEAFADVPEVQKAFTAAFRDLTLHLDDLLQKGP